MLVRTKILLVTMLVSILLISIVIINASATNPYFELGSKLKDVKLNPKNDQIIATINGSPVSKLQYESKRIFLEEAYKQSGKNKPTANEIFNEIAKDRLMYQEAVSRGLEVSDEDVKVVMQSIQDKIKKSTNSEKLSAHTDFNAGTGLSEEEYWNSEEVFKAYKRMLTIGKLHDQIAKQMGISKEKRSDPEVAKEIEEKIQKYAEDLLLKADIRQLNLE